MGKGFMDFFNSVDADAFCIQETKLQAGQIEMPLEGWHQYWDYAEKKGYSGTAIFCREADMWKRGGVAARPERKQSMLPIQISAR